MSSADLRLFAKQIVRRPRQASPARSRDASPSALARSPGSASRSGGFQSAIVRSARGAASPSTTVGVLSRQRLRELAGVGDRRGGEQELRLGAVDPASRRSRRRTFATCEPKTPR